MGASRRCLTGCECLNNVRSLVVRAPLRTKTRFFVLMEDDSSIYELNVTTDRLLIPYDEHAHRNVMAVINVRTRTFSGASDNFHDHAGGA